VDVPRLRLAGGAVRDKTRTEHAGAKRGCGAYYGRKVEAKRVSNKARRRNDRRAEGAR